MKFKTTRKEINNNYDKILKLGYCEASTLLRAAREVAYTSGVYGWNFDLFEAQNSNGNIVAICTGYRNMAGVEPSAPVTEFEKRAAALISYNFKSWDAYIEALRLILVEWLDACTL